MRLGILSRRASRMVANDVACGHVHNEVHAQVPQPVVILDVVDLLGDDHDRIAHTQSLVQIEVCDRVLRERYIMVQSVCQFHGVACRIGFGDRRHLFLQPSNLLRQKTKMKSDWLQPI